MIRAVLLPLLALFLLAAAPAAARVLTVGPGLPLAFPSQAALAVEAGDTVRILAGRYDDCAVWRDDRLVLEGEGEVILSGRNCEGQGVFTVNGNDVTVRNLTLTRARNYNHNGAGIRASGINLKVENVRFLDNEEGILARANPDSTITVSHSLFRGNGDCISDAGCAHGVYAGQIALLRIEHCEFIAQRAGHHIKSRAARTEILDNRIADGPDGTSSYLIDLSEAGAILIRGNRMEKGPKSQNRQAAIVIGAERKTAPDPGDRIVIENNVFANDVGQPTVFVRNLVATPAVLNNNHLSGAAVPLSGRGTVDGKKTGDQKPPRP